MLECNTCKIGTKYTGELSGSMTMHKNTLRWPVVAAFNVVFFASCPRTRPNKLPCDTFLYFLLIEPYRATSGN